MNTSNIVIIACMYDTYMKNQLNEMYYKYFIYSTLNYITSKNHIGINLNDNVNLKKKL